MVICLTPWYILWQTLYLVYHWYILPEPFRDTPSPPLELQICQILCWINWIPQYQSQITIWSLSLRGSCPSCPSKVFFSGWVWNMWSSEMRLKKKKTFFGWIFVGPPSGATGKSSQVMEFPIARILEKDLHLLSPNGGFCSLLKIPSSTNLQQKGIRALLGLFHYLRD